MIAPWVLFEDNQSKDYSAIFAQNPIAQVRANKWSEVENALQMLEEYISLKKYIFGFISYEFGLGLENNTRQLIGDYGPLFWFGIFDDIESLDLKEIGNATDGFAVSNLNPDMDFELYHEQFRKIKRYIEKGDIYQANLTFKKRAKFWGSPIALYKKLRNLQPVSYSAFLDLGDFQILSLSPELFFKTEGRKIETHPMKGTMGRGKDLVSDALNQELLESDTKQRAENLMITDLMRNDLSRICLAGTVKVPKLFAIEKYPSVFQMISKIKGQLKPNISNSDVIKGLFPAGSIVGCPKLRATEIIAACEIGPRGIYCGSIGIIKPNGDMSFNVAIRTPIIRNNEIEIGVGSGIVFDSTATKEYEECLLKAKYLENSAKEFALLETIKWNGSGFENLNLHLARLKNSANFFEIYLDIAEIEKSLFSKAAKYKDILKRVRIKISFQETNIEFHDFEHQNKIYRICIHPIAVNSESLWLKHKTTNRCFYDDSFLEYSAQGFDEVVFINQNGEITEGSRTNIYFDFGHGLITPKLECGVLPGVLRERLIKGRQATEGVIRKEDLKHNPHIYIGNSLRGLIRAKLELN